LVVVLNFCVVITVNALYIYSTQQALDAFVHLLLQFSLSVFRLLYSATAGPVLARSVHNAAANVRFRFMLSMINNLLLPCLVVALTSDACFQVVIKNAVTFFRLNSFVNMIAFLTFSSCFQRVLGRDCLSRQMK
jgi:hypothetical protein